MFDALRNFMYDPQPETYRPGGLEKCPSCGEQDFQQLNYCPSEAWLYCRTCKYDETKEAPATMHRMCGICGKDQYDHTEEEAQTCS